MSGSGCPPHPPPPGNGFTKSVKPRHWVGFSFKIKKSPRRWDMCCPRSIFSAGFSSKSMSICTETKFPRLWGRIFITYMICPGFGLVICEKTCPGFGLSFGFHGVHPYQKNICNHPPPPPPLTRNTMTLRKGTMILSSNMVE